MDFRVLGAVEVRAGERPVVIRDASTRTVLALLLLNAGKLVAVDFLVDELWAESPPRDARVLVQGYVSRFRRAARAARIDADQMSLQTRGAGYVLTFEDDKFDLHRFESLISRARLVRSDGRFAAAWGDYEQALREWRGEPFGDARMTECLQSEATRLRELRLLTLEEKYEVELAEGHDATVLPELVGAVAQHPHRPRLVAQLMLALHGTGRSSDALKTYEKSILRLRTEVGLDPPADLQRMQLAVLRNDVDILTIMQRVRAVHDQTPITTTKPSARQVGPPPPSARFTTMFPFVYSITRHRLFEAPVPGVQWSHPMEREQWIDAGTYDLWQLMGDQIEQVADSFPLEEGQYGWKDELSPDTSERYRHVTTFVRDDDRGSPISWTGWWRLSATGEHTWGTRIRRRS